ncbi:MAG: bifunctional nuclease family protein [candidate division KSB1 bacterium]|nr:bifunctional nuclease family protein [candidate division KSB1 bacterium]MDZ7300965.1 bifunctional nuclease family protein [candidate division KSB1 bacterium]MDZ7310357.1 bifunctional nuclease family protein [candidate division KSB1 bacterium]
MLVAVRVDRVTLDTTANRFVVILRDDAHHRWLPIVVGSSEAQAIALQMENIIPPRPLTHDLVKNLLDSVEVRISRVVVNDLRENTYFAMIGLKMNGNHVEVDARPSDAIAIALRAQAPIFVDDEVMKKASVSDKDSERMEDEIMPVDRLERLNYELQKAVSEERFEDAARLRDEINVIKKERRDER